VIPRLEVSRVARPYDRTAGTYVYVEPKISDCVNISTWSKHLGIPIPKETLTDLHCTVMWSKDVTNDASCDPSQAHVAQLDHFEYWDGHDGDGYIVAVLTSWDLHQLHNKWKLRGCRHSFPDYMPHVTLMSKIRPSDVLLRRLESASKSLYGTPIVFLNEQIENAKA
jgi:hypothetical protein